MGIRETPHSIMQGAVMVTDRSHNPAYGGSIPSPAIFM